MSILYAIAGTVAYLWAFWVLYVFVMGVYRAKLAGRLYGLSYALAWPIFILGYSMDIVANLTIASIVFVEVPRELLVTARLKRHVKACDGWRASLANWICNNLLDIFDPSGNHC